MSTVTKPINLDETQQRVATALETIAESYGKCNLVITCTASDGVTVTDQTIRIYNNTTGALYGTITYMGQSITVQVPYGFSYKIVPDCSLSMHYTTQKPSGIATSSTINIGITYYSLGTVSTFPQLQGILDAGLGQYLPIGTQVSYTDSDLGVMTYDVVDYDAVNNEFTVCLHDVLNTQYQFDAPEALYGGALAAGDYSFTHDGTTYYFTLTTAIPAGGQLVATTSAFATYASGYSTTALETGTVSTTAISGATSLGTTGSGSLNHWDRAQYGSNDYGESNLRKWLNADDDDWWIPSTMFDRPSPYVGTNGFMHGIPSEVLDCIKTATVKCHENGIYSAPDSLHTKNQPYAVSDKFFLLSEKEVFGSATYDDGSAYFNDYFTNATKRIKYYNSSARMWWLRSPNSYANLERSVHASGSASYGGSNSTLSVAPACIVCQSA